MQDNIIPDDSEDYEEKDYSGVDDAIHILNDPLALSQAVKDQYL